jgi:hypothetical protein
MELSAFVFVRTRSSIKYYPKFVSMANVLFLYYINSTMYACQYEALALLQNYSLFWLMFFINRYEYESVNNWNPFGTWTPTEANPRCGYHPVFLDSHYNIGFNIFSLFMPLHFREQFTVDARNAH